jgi:membrane protein
MRRVKSIFTLVREAATGFIADQAPRQAATVAFYMIFSLAPLVAFSVAIAGTLFGEAEVQEEVVGWLYRLAGPSAAGAFETIVDSTRTDEGLGAVGIIGVPMLLFGASAVFAQLRESLNRIWALPAPKREGWRKFLRQRVIALLMLLAIQIFLIATLLVSAGVSLAADWVAFPGGGVLLRAIQLAVVFLLFTLLLALGYRYVPAATIGWKNVWFGAAVTAGLYTLGQLAIGAYLGRSNLASAYGAAGSLVIVLIWIYYSIVIVFFGAELTEVYSRRGTAAPREHLEEHQSRPRPERRRIAGGVRSRLRPVATHGAAAAGGVLAGFAAVLLGVLVVLRHLIRRAFR